MEDSAEMFNSPVNKKLKLEIKEESKIEEPESKEIDTVASNHCPHCDVYIAGNKAHINRHILRSCPYAPGLDELESARRKKKLTKRESKVEVKIETKSELAGKIEGGQEESSYPKFSGGDCGCRGSTHTHDCLRLRGGAAHMRLPHVAPAPHLAPDPDFLAPHLLRPIIPVIQAINQRFSNRQNRWIAHLGPPQLVQQLQNPLWHRVANSFQIPSMFPESRFQDLFFFTRQQAYQIRNAVIYPMLQQRAAQAQTVLLACS